MLTYGAYLARHKTCRGGVIPYTIVGNRVYFLLARHGETNELGDFGGGVKKSEFSLNGSFREYDEESNGIFSKYYSSSNDFLDKLALVDGERMAVVFVPIDKTWLRNRNAQKAFTESKNENGRKSSNEISEVVWVDEEKFVQLVTRRTSRNEDKLWTLVQKFFLKIHNVREIANALRTISTGQYSRGCAVEAF